MDLLTKKACESDKNYQIHKLYFTNFLSYFLQLLHNLI